jgi:drug/metabolite transporter (DMT)-like permease
MSSRRLGVAAAALVLAGGQLAHALDEEGLLPGVREAARVREFGERGAARPLLLLCCLAVSAATGALVARRRTRTPAALALVVVLGQAVQFTSFEVVARVAAGLDVAEAFAEPAFVTGVAVQVLLAAAFTSLLVLATRRALALLTPPGLPWQPPPPAPGHRTRRRAGSRRPVSPVRGRAPPRVAPTVP